MRKPGWSSPTGQPSPWPWEWRWAAGTEEPPGPGSWPPAPGYSAGPGNDHTHTISQKILLDWRLEKHQSKKQNDEKTNLHKFTMENLKKDNHDKPRAHKGLWELLQAKWLSLCVLERMWWHFLMKTTEQQTFIFWIYVLKASLEQNKTYGYNF